MYGAMRRTGSDVVGNGASVGVKADTARNESSTRPQDGRISPHQETELPLLEPKQFVAQNPVNKRRFPCKNRAKSLPFAAF
jgi:hypothetical protein